MTRGFRRWAVRDLFPSGGDSRKAYSLALKMASISLPKGAYALIGLEHEGIEARNHLAHEAGKLAVRFRKDLWD